MPGVPESTLVFFELASIIWPIFLTPLANVLMGDGEVSFCQQLFDLTEAERETMVEPSLVTDNFGGKARLLLAGHLIIHVAQSANPGLN